MFKKTKLFVGVALLVQTVTSVFMFFILLAKKKSIAGAFLALAALTGAAGGYILYDCKKEEELSFGCLDCEEDYDCCDCDCCTEDDMDLDGDLFVREEETVTEEAAEA